MSQDIKTPPVERKQSSGDETSRDLDAIAWAMLFIWAGTTLLIHAGLGWFLLGVGAIMAAGPASIDPSQASVSRGASPKPRPARLTPIKDRVVTRLIVTWNSLREAAMTYKTILVHCTDERRMPNLLGPAIALARRCEAHLIAFSVLPPVLVDPALTPGGIVTIIDGHRKVYEKEQVRMKAIFEDSTRNAGISAEWLVADADRGNVWSKVVDYGRSADLIVAPQADPQWSFSELVEAPAELVLHSGRPVLFIPNIGNHANFGRRALIAWNGRRESARAASDAVPLLKLAEEVSVLWINPEQDKTAQDVPGADLCTSLARHGVKCEASGIDRPEQSAGETLLARVRHTHADLLVMGCYGHSRLREFILGGATRQVLKDMSVPVLMSH